MQSLHDSVQVVHGRIRSGSDRAHENRMSPTTPKTEAEVADAIERWVEAARVLENLKPEYKLPEPYKITALESLMNVGQGKLHFEGIKAQDVSFDDLLQKCRDYALRRRLENNHKRSRDDMDVDRVEDSENSMDMGGRSWDTEDWGSTHEYLEAVYKGKGKGKGKYGKPDGMHGKGGSNGGWWTTWNTGKGIGGQGRRQRKQGERKRRGKRKGQRAKEAPKVDATTAASQGTSRGNAQMLTRTTECVRTVETMDTPRSIVGIRPECRT